MEWIGPAPQRRASTGSVLLNLAATLGPLLQRKPPTAAMAPVNALQANPGQAPSQPPSSGLGPTLSALGSPDAWQTALANYESGGKYDIANDSGYLGKYQFGEAALHDIGMYNDPSGNYRDNDWGGSWTVPGVDSRETFLSNPNAQETAFGLHSGRIQDAIRAAGLDSMIGQQIDGVPITMGGLISAAHLGGVGGLTQWLRGGTNRSDSNGTSLLDYMRLGAGQ